MTQFSGIVGNLLQGVRLHTSLTYGDDPSRRFIAIFTASAVYESLCYAFIYCSVCKHVLRRSNGVQLDTYADGCQFS